MSRVDVVWIFPTERIWIICLFWTLVWLLSSIRNHQFVDKKQIWHEACFICVDKLRLEQNGHYSTDGILHKFCLVKSFAFHLEFHGSVLLRVQLKINQHLWLEAKQRISHRLNEWWTSSLTIICLTRPQWVDIYIILSEVKAWISNYNHFCQMEVLSHMLFLLYLDFI